MSGVDAVNATRIVGGWPAVPGSARNVGDHGTVRPTFFRPRSQSATGTKSVPTSSAFTSRFTPWPLRSAVSDTNDGDASAGADTSTRLR